MLDLNEVRLKKAGVLTDEEKEFLNENKDDLTIDEIEDYKDILTDK